MGPFPVDARVVHLESRAFIHRTFKEKDRGDGARKRHGQQVRISGSMLRELREVWDDFKMT